jgi:hypothetical protein
MGMKDPLPTFTTFMERIHATHPNLAYVHVVEPGIHGDGDLSSEGIIPSSEALRKAQVIFPTLPRVASTIPWLPALWRSTVVWSHLVVISLRT